MKFFLIHGAVTMAQISELAQHIADSKDPSLSTLTSAVQDMINHHADRIVAMALYRVVGMDGVTYHVAGMLDIDGKTIVVHDRQKAASIPDWVLPSPFTELEVLQDKARRYDQIVAAADAKELRFLYPPEVDSFDTIGELHAYLDTDLNKWS
ncbi:hypothetical protein D3C85_14140 [compost metagenome]